MPLLEERDKKYLTDEFARTLSQPVKLVVFTQSLECDFCREMREIAEEIAALSPKLSVEVHDFVAEKELAVQFDIEQIPAMVILRGGDTPKDYHIHYYGVPAGYEFSSLIHDIMMVSSGETGLSDEAKRWAATLTKPVHLQVFVTPTCPYCPQAVVLAHKLAMESDLIRADMVEATEFPHLAVKYNVMGVPRTVINEDLFIEGAVPEAVLLKKVKEVTAR